MGTKAPLLAALLILTAPLIFAQSLALNGVRHWAYWLANIDPEQVAVSPFDMLIVDYSADGSEAKAFRRTEVVRMQRRPDGTRRLLLAYLSVGEAEDYRSYWQSNWSRHPPAWLDRENPSWPGNYKVHYWDPQWQKIILGNPGSYLDRIIQAGFDGVMLDIVDAYEYFQPSRPRAAQEMISFVERIAAYAHSKKPGFLVLPQNAEPLLADSGYLAAVDGAVKEDLYFGVRRDGAANPPDAVDYSISFLDKVPAVGKPVFLVEYVRRGAQVDEVYRRARAAGFVPYAARRALATLTINRGWDTLP